MDLPPNPVNFGQGTTPFKTSVYVLVAKSVKKLGKSQFLVPWGHLMGDFGFIFTIYD